MAELTTVLQKIDAEAGVAWLTFQPAGKENAMSQKFMAELIAALKELAENDKIKCVVTTGSGDSYSSGLDLYDLRESWKRKRAWDHAGTTYEIVRSAAQYAPGYGRRGARLVSRRRFGADQRPRSLHRSGVGEVRHAGSHPRQLRRGGDLDVVSQRHSDQEGVLHSAHRAESNRRPKPSGSGSSPRSCQTISWWRTSNSWPKNWAAVTP